MLLQIFLIFVICAILILAYCSDIKGTTTYQDVVLSVCGRNAQRMCSFTLMVYCFGTCITFLIIIGDQWEECKYTCTTIEWLIDGCLMPSEQFLAILWWEPVTFWWDKVTIWLGMRWWWCLLCTKPTRLVVFLLC